MKSHKPGNKQKILGALNPIKEPDYIEGEPLAHLLKLIQRGIETARLSDGESLPEKIWLKQQFAIGINEVTRVLERMKPCVDPQNSSQNTDLMQQNPRGSTIRLQAVVLAADCKPRMLTKHIQSIAASRNVPIFYVRDNRRASLRLGELLKLKTALAIGIKVRNSAINQILEPILRNDGIQDLECVDTACGDVQTPGKS